MNARFSGRKRVRMDAEVIYLRDDYIKLGQAMKAAHLVGSGVEAKLLIQDGQVRVNGEVETRRGKKLVDGDVVEYDGNTVRISARGSEI